jgi:hypothetical protein
VELDKENPSSVIMRVDERLGGHGWVSEIRRRGHENGV